MSYRSTNPMKKGADDIEPQKLGVCRVVLFDLDGVLVDSREVMRDAWEEVQSTVEVTVPFEHYFREIGRPFSEIVIRLGLRDKLTEITSVYCTTTMLNASRVRMYEGVDQALVSLVNNGIQIGVVTSKHRHHAEIALEQFTADFSCLKTPEDGPGKPAPDLLFAALADASGEAAEAIYVGDMEVDREAASNANIKFVHAAWGYGVATRGTSVLETPDAIRELYGALRIEDAESSMAIVLPTR